MKEKGGHHAGQEEQGSHHLGRGRIWSGGMSLAIMVKEGEAGEPFMELIQCWLALAREKGESKPCPKPASMP
jgi:hypothetical protein